MASTDGGTVFGLSRPAGRARLPRLGIRAAVGVSQATYATHRDQVFVQLLAEMGVNFSTCSDSHPAASPGCCSWTPSSHRTVARRAARSPAAGAGRLASLAPPRQVPCGQITGSGVMPYWGILQQRGRFRRLLRRRGGLLRHPWAAFGFRGGNLAYPHRPGRCMKDTTGRGTGSSLPWGSRFNTCPSRASRWRPPPAVCWSTSTGSRCWAAWRACRWSG